MNPELIARAIARRRTPQLTPKALALISAAEAPVTHRVARVHHDASPTDAARRKYFPHLNPGTPTTFTDRRFHNHQ